MITLNTEGRKQKTNLVSMEEHIQSSAAHAKPAFSRYVNDNLGGGSMAEKHRMHSVSLDILKCIKFQEGVLGLWFNTHIRPYYSCFYSVINVLSSFPYFASLLLPCATCSPSSQILLLLIHYVRLFPSNSYCNYLMIWECVKFEQGYRLESSC